MIVPQKVDRYKNGERSDRLKKVKTLRYKTPQGWIDVLVWHQYPSYDFIFGVLESKHELYKQEAAFIQYRDVRRKKVEHGYYLDWGELKVWGRGLDALRNYWKKRRRP